MSGPQLWRKVEFPPGMRPVYRRCSYCRLERGEMLVSLSYEDDQDYLNIHLCTRCLGRPRGLWKRLIREGAAITASVWGYCPGDVGELSRGVYELRLGGES